MKRNKFAARRDENEPEIIAALEARGIDVTPIQGRGKKEPPDLLCGFAGLTVLIEVKRDYDYATTKRGKPYVEHVRGKLTPDQTKWHREWKGQPVVIARTVQEALAAFGLEMA
jgi:Holliday junction resolvase